jgi:hypothetical protein
MIANILTMPQSSKYVAYLTYSCALGLITFFHHSGLVDAFDSSNGAFEWYAIFSNAIFQPNYSYIAESILLPLLAKILGASASLQSYRLLCAFMTLLIVPVLALHVERHLRDLSKSAVCITFFSLTFPYLWKFWLGYPDPLTIICLITAALAQNRTAIALGAFFAALSHFSIASLSLVSLGILFWAAPEQRDVGSRKKIVLLLLLGLVAGKLVLSMWFMLFEYKIESRLNIVLTEGLTRFIEQGHQRGALAFWLTPGSELIVGALLLSAIAFARQQYRLSLGMILALLMAYFGVFFTIDSFRVFAVIISAPYVFLLVTIFKGDSKWLARVTQCLESIIVWCYQKITTHYSQGLITVGIVLFWVTALITADRNGLLLNHLPYMQAETKNPNAMLGLIGLTGLAGLISAMVQLTHPYKWLARITKLGFWLPLLLIAVQYFRQIYSPNDGLSTLAKLVIVIFILCGGYALSCIATSPAKINQYIKGLFA